MHTPTAAEMIRALDLKPHPEGGHYRETFRDPKLVEGRPASTAILFLLAHGERSPGTASTWSRSGTTRCTAQTVIGQRRKGSLRRCGYPLRRSAAGDDPCAHGNRPKLWGLDALGCTVAPGFSFEDFELAPTGWSRAIKSDKTSIVLKGNAVAKKTRSGGWSHCEP